MLWKRVDIMKELVVFIPEEIETIEQVCINIKWDKVKETVSKYLKTIYESKQATKKKDQIIIVKVKYIVIEIKESEIVSR